MRHALPVTALLAVSPPAAAEVATEYELGYIRHRTAVTEHTALDGEALRFAFRVRFGTHVYVGAEAEEGNMVGTSTLPDGSVARTTTSEPTGPLDGNMLALRVVGGTHARLGPIGLGAGLAVGIRDSWVSGDQGMDIAGYKYEPLFEARARADVWITPRWTLGLTGSTDLRERRNVATGLLVTLRL